MYSSDYDDDSSNNGEEDIQYDDECISNTTLAKTILHLDVDCFYCQAEEIRNPQLAGKPFAVGQKQIVVTSNYIARALGVQKLMSRNMAKEICPSLIIIEGSDLEPYRSASQSIYQVFREAVKELNSNNSCKKGGMDECFADITPSIREADQNYNRTTSVWIYGEDEKSSNVEIREDQSGSSAKIEFKLQNPQLCSPWGSEEELRQCKTNLFIGAILATDIQEKVRSQTRFSVTIGVSVSPMLAKIASGLKKPRSCNILYPDRSGTLIANMPLRRIPGLGSQTLKRIIPALEKYNGARKENTIWTCKDFLNTPSHAILSCVGNRDSQFDLLDSRCRGIDPTIVVDDDGGLSKSVSVEETFIRGSLTSLEEVYRNLDVLYSRILRLLDLRRDSSPSPKLSYPTAVRLTVRLFDSKTSSEKRPFKTISRQTDLDGKLLMSMEIHDDRIVVIQRAVFKLMDVLTKSNQLYDLNVTKLNLATIAFADISSKLHRSKHGSIKKFFSRNIPDPKREPEYSYHEVATNGNFDTQKDIRTRFPLKRSQILPSFTHSKQMKVETENSSILPNGIDAEVFAALPQDIAREVLMNHSFHTKESSEISKKKCSGIEKFFVKK